MSSSQVKLRGWVLMNKSGFPTSIEGASMLGAGGTIPFLTRGILRCFSLGGGGRWFHPWQCSALPVTGARTVLHTTRPSGLRVFPVRAVLEPARPESSPWGWSGHRLGAFSPRGREARGSCPGSAALGAAAVPPSSAGCWRRPRGGWRDLCPPSSAPASRCPRVRFLLFIYSRNSALPSFRGYAGDCGTCSPSKACFG